jgi:hypothetical protein
MSAEMESKCITSTTSSKHKRNKIATLKTPPCIDLSEKPPTLLNISDSTLAKLLVVLRALPDRMRSLNTNLPIFLPQPRNALHLRLNTEDVSKLINIRTFTSVGATKGRDNFSADGTECPEGPRTRKVWDYGHWATGTVDELQGFDMVDLFLQPGNFLGKYFAQEVSARVEYFDSGCAGWGH